MVYILLLNGKLTWVFLKQRLINMVWQIDMFQSKYMQLVLDMHVYTKTLYVYIWMWITNLKLGWAAMFFYSKLVKSIRYRPTFMYSSLMVRSNTLMEIYYVDLNVWHIYTRVYRFERKPAICIIFLQLSKLYVYWQFYMNACRFEQLLNVIWKPKPQFPVWLRGAMTKSKYCPLCTVHNVFKVSAQICSHSASILEFALRFTWKYIVNGWLSNVLCSVFLVHLFKFLSPAYQVKSNIMIEPFFFVLILDQFTNFKFYTYFLNKGCSWQRKSLPNMQHLICKLLLLLLLLL